MFCEQCGEKLNIDDQFCVHCGVPINTPQEPVSSIQPVRRSYEFFWFKYAKVLFGIVVVAFIGYISINNDSSEEGWLDEEELYGTALSELGPSMEPVGFFNDMSLFDSETISDEEWFSHLKYYDVEEVKYTNTFKQFTNRDEVFSSVVKIVCEDEEYLYYGSGTNVDPSGYVLTNHHVIEGAPEDSCMVGFPDPLSGLVKEAYWVSIIADKDNETGHDLAYLAIEEPVFDEDGYLYGYYDKIERGGFPHFEDTDECLNTEMLLGEKILILGYPPLSGEALTVTNGLISSLYSPNNYLITSAKIVSGNSGGLAIDERGCYVGVPTAVYSDKEVDDEKLGEIIDAEFVFEFNKAIEDDLEEYYKINEIVE